LQVLNENTFKITVRLQDAPDKIFTFQTLSKGSLATWITILNLQMYNAEIMPASLATQEQAALAPRNFWKVSRITSRELVENA